MTHLLSAVAAVRTVLPLAASLGSLLAPVIIPLLAAIIGSLLIASIVAALLVAAVIAALAPVIIAIVRPVAAPFVTVAPRPLSATLLSLATPELLALAAVLSLAASELRTFAALLRSAVALTSAVRLALECLRGTGVWLIALKRLLHLRRLRKSVCDRRETIVLLDAFVLVLDFLSRFRQETHRLLLRLLSSRNHAVVMLGVLKVIFRHHRIPRRLRIAGQLKVFFSDVLSGTANLHVRTVTLKRAGQRIRPFAAVIAVVAAAPQTLVLPWSHFTSLMDRGIRKRPKGRTNS